METFLTQKKRPRDLNSRFENGVVTHRWIKVMQLGDDGHPITDKKGYPIMVWAEVPLKMIAHLNPDIEKIIPSLN